MNRDAHKNAHIANLTTAGDVQSHHRSEELVQLPALTIISHPQMSRAGQSAFLLRKGETQLSRLSPDFLEIGKTWGEGLNDPHLSRKAILLTAQQSGVTIDNRTLGKKLKVNGEDCQGSRHITAGELKAGVTLELSDRICLLLHLKTFGAPTMPCSSSLLGVSDAALKLRQQIAQVADLSIPVMLLGASGTGKEVVASELAANQSGPYIRVNMAAIPPNLAASELFGTTRGSFTGAEKDRQGYFTAAHGGTLFMDEIGEVPSELQPLLLRALENGEVQAVGAREVKKVKVRMITATDANLDDLVSKGHFRAPLLHRLSGFVIKMPTLAERPEDLGLLIYHFAQKTLAEINGTERLNPTDLYARPWLPPDLACALLRCPWPGNIRQLRNTINHLAIAHRDQETLEWNQLARDMLKVVPRKPNTPVKANDLTEQQIREALQICNFDIKATATQLGVSRPALYRRMEKFPGIRKPNSNL